MNKNKILSSVFYGLLIPILIFGAAAISNLFIFLYYNYCWVLICTYVIICMLFILLLKIFAKG